MLSVIKILEIKHCTKILYNCENKIEKFEKILIKFGSYSLASIFLVLLTYYEMLAKV